MAPSQSFIPQWYEEETPDGTYRSLFKWGDPKEFKHPNRRLVKLMMETFGMTPADFAARQKMGLETVVDDVPVTLTPDQIAALQAIVGKEHLSTDTYTRIKVSYGAGMIDALRLRRGCVENLPDAVVTPRSKDEIEAIVRFCDEQRLPLYVFGGGSSVTRGMEAVKGGVTIDMSAHMNHVVRFNEVDQTITVEAGMWGPQLEQALNRAPELFGASHRYTCGHFPQSFEYSSVGGWVVTRGAGQNSTYYGKIEDMVIAQEYITPIGILKTAEHPRAATGPDMDQVMMGGEGAFGVLVEVTLRVFHWMPENHHHFAYMFRDWETAQRAAREIMQGEFGFPSVFRLSDPEETDVAMKLYGIEGTPADSILQTLGYQPMQKCLLLGFTEGERGFSRHVDRQIRRLCRAAGAFDLSPFRVAQAWEKSRFRDPYMREDLQDYGILIDTLECGVTWSQMPQVHASVRQVVKNRPDTICMTHISHVYPQGGNLYFIFIARIGTIREYLDLQYSILQAIQDSGASISHHHGVGKQTSPWLEGQIGAASMDVIRSLKEHFDPHHILNPGGTLGLDMSPAQREKVWSKDLEG